MPPPLYADRFLTFVAHEVLHAELAPEAAAIDERWRAGGWLARCKQLLAQWCGLDKAWSRRPRQGGLPAPRAQARAGVLTDLPLLCFLFD